MPEFASPLIRWQKRHGRHGLPWQGTRDPYRIWLSEVMLQQTQVAAVVPYYERFLARFPDLGTLASSSVEDVLRLWSGLGYYARGRNLHRAAREIVERHGGRFPRTAAALAGLPGIGRSTAAAIAAFAYGERAAILDGNVKRVLARRFGVSGFPGEKAVEGRLWALADRLLPERGIETYTQALMDLGATVCTRVRPACEACPVARACLARRRGLVEKIPAPRPARPLPVRRAVWLLLAHRGRLLLMRRPAEGVWGGLWTFPEPEGADLAGYCRRALGCEVEPPRPLPGLVHGFTHFRLEITPVLCEVRVPGTPPGGRWATLRSAGAVPAPVRRLLEEHALARAARPRRPSREAPASAGGESAAPPPAARSPRRSTRGAAAPGRAVRAGR